MAKRKKKKARPSKKVTVLPASIDVNYLKTNNYRTYHVDGIFGGPTVHGKLYVELFLERAVTPRIIKHKVTPKGKLGEEVSRIGKEGIIREIEAGLIMDLGTAKVFRNWLDEKIKFTEKKLKS